MYLSIGNSSELFSLSYIFDSFILKSFCHEIALEKVASHIVEILLALSNHSIEVHFQVHFAPASSSILSIKYSESFSSSFLFNTLYVISNK